MQGILYANEKKDNYKLKRLYKDFYDVWLISFYKTNNIKNMLIKHS